MVNHACRNHFYSDVFQNDVFHSDVFENDVFHSDVFDNDVFHSEVFNNCLVTCISSSFNKILNDRVHYV